MTQMYNTIIRRICYPATFLTLICSCSTPRPILSKAGGAVASAHALATKAGLDILERGGNAFDAAVAVAATLNVVEPMMSGVAGYGSILIYDAQKKQVRYLNSSGRFPEKADSDQIRTSLNYLKNQTGPKSIATPGNLKAWEELHRNYGHVNWNFLFQAAIFHAEHGYKITANQAKWLKDSFEFFQSYPRSFYGRNGEPLREGDLLVQTDLAKTLRLIAEQGADPIYRGEIAHRIDKQMKDIGSFLSLEDLRKNKAEWWAPIQFNYRDYEIYTAGFPATSFAGFVPLGMMQEFNPTELGHESTEYQHLVAEMLKESDMARITYACDPDVKVCQLETIMSQNFIKSRAKSINKDRASEYKLPLSEESRNTTHFVVIDQKGNIVSATQTLGNAFGSKIMIEGTGIWMNSSMAFATFEPKGNPMDVFPGRHKLSSDFPAIIMKDGRPWATLGTPGGHTITQNIPQVIFNLLDFKMSMQEAIDAPKLAFVAPDLIQVEKNFPEKARRSLTEKGHHVKESSIGNTNGIRIIYDQEGKVQGFDIGVDKRRDGQVTMFISDLQ